MGHSDRRLQVTHHIEAASYGAKRRPGDETGLRRSKISIDDQGKGTGQYETRSGLPVAQISNGGECSVKVGGECSGQIGGEQATHIQAGTGIHIALSFATGSAPRRC